MVRSYKVKRENITNHEDMQAAFALVLENGYSMTEAAKEKGASWETHCLWSKNEKSVKKKKTVVSSKECSLKQRKETLLNHCSFKTWLAVYHWWRANYSLNLLKFIS